MNQPAGSLVKTLTCCLIATTLMLAAPAARAAMPDFGNVKENIPGWLKGQEANAGTGSAADLPPSPVDMLASDDMKVSVVTGVSVGAFLGAVIAKTGGDEDEMAEKAAIGAAIGLVGGLAAGQVAKSRREKFDSESAYLDAEIDSTNQAIDARSQEIADYEKSIADAETRVADLEARHARNRNVSRKAAQEMDKLEESIAQNQKVLAQMEASIEYLDETLAESRSRKAATEAEQQELLALQAQLSERRDELGGRYQRLHEANERGVQVAARLESLTART